MEELSKLPKKELVARLERTEETVWAALAVLIECGDMLGVGGEMELGVEGNETRGVFATLIIGDRVIEGKEALLMYHGALIVLAKTKPATKGKR
jgi:hypothetical protein